MNRRTALLVGAAALSVALAVVLALLARDVRTWDSSVHEADLALSRGQLPQARLEPDELLPFEISKRALRVRDDLGFREAVRLFQLSRPVGEEAIGTVQWKVQARAQSQVLLGRHARKDDDPRRRARSLNLLGVLALEDAAVDQNRAPLLTRTALDSFRAAIRDDPDNADIKFNLELLLSDPDTVQLIERSRRGRQGGGPAGAGTQPPRRGEGY